MATLAGRNLPAKARARGLRVIEWDEWESKSEGSFDALAVLLHHDGLALGYVDSDESNNLNVVKNMSQPGALGSQLWIGRNTAGQMCLVFMKAGRASHAGTGRGFRSIPADMGNAVAVGIETDHTTGTGWDTELMHYIDVTTRLLVEEFDLDPQRDLAGHREYAPDRKPDPESFDLDAWRSRAAIAPTKNDTDGWLTMGAKEDIIKEIRYGNDKVMEGKGAEKPVQNIRLVRLELAESRKEIAAARKEIAALAAAVAKLPKA